MAQQVLDGLPERSPVKPRGIAVVYYTWSWGNTEKVAVHVADRLGAELYRLDTVVPYPRVEDAVVAQAEVEVRDRVTPEIESADIPWERYGTVIVGCPVWWLSIAPAMRTFLVDNREVLRDKTVSYFLTRAQWPGTAAADLEALLSDCRIIEGFECEFGTEAAYELVTDLSILDAWIETLPSRT